MSLQTLHCTDLHQYVPTPFYIHTYKNTLMDALCTGLGDCLCVYGCKNALVYASLYWCIGMPLHSPLYMPLQERPYRCVYTSL